jgi:hypothetical protein
VSREPALGTTRFTAWLARNADWLGRSHLSELSAHFDAAQPPGCLARRMLGA